MLTRGALILLLLPLAACATGELPPSARLPGDMVTGATDPMRSAILNSAYTFNRQSSPSDKARAAAMVEFLAADYRWDVRWSEYTPTAGPALTAARAELHAAFGVLPSASPQAVVDGFVAASRALDRGLSPFFPPNVFSAPDAMMARLAQADELPATRVATGMVESELHRIDAERFSGGGPGGQGGTGGAHP